MAENKGVLVCGEIDSKLASITTELLGCGRKLADDLKEDLSCLLVGDKIGDAAKEAIAFGADKVYTVEDSLLKQYQADSFIQVVEKVAKDTLPRIVLFGQTSMGRELAPRLAFRLGVCLSTDCLDLTIDPNTKLLRQTRPVYGGNAQAIFVSEFMPQVVTVRPKAMSPIERDALKQVQGNIIPTRISIDTTKVRTKVLETVKEEVVGVKLEDAPVIVSGGRGMRGPEPFKTILKELADLLHGAVGASRPPADNGWVPEATHVGLTGKIVAPDVYIAVAISGASQHIAGCSGSKHIIAINKDPEANIFKEAEFGVVGKWEEILPAFTNKLKELL
ncbi:MAG: electron transfer flavoprotein subunit alpha [Chloroflexi bacterium CG08_land_8_20_14_0_20_45_12]|nr:MAG: electron transfer flavoprotein subunit alpha [Chloroflexi bacterium CG08_land_8_20_14_0_20_45_12]